MHIGSKAAGGEPYEVCDTVQQEYEYSAAAVAVNSRLIEVRNLVFDTTRLTSLPKKALLTRKEIRNLAEVSVTSAINLTVSSAASWSISKTFGLSTTVGASVGMQVGIPNVGTGSLTVNWSQTVSASTQQSEGGSTAVTRSTMDTVTIGPRKSISFELLAYQTTIDVPFSAWLIIDGDVDSNLAGISSVSELVAEAERTIQFAGTLRISDVSDAFLNVQELGGISAGENAAESIESSETSLFLPVTANSQYLAKFTRQNMLPRVGDAISTAVSTALGLFGTDSEIGPPDGISYEILSVFRVYKPTVACGFNDLGIVNGGIFRVEARQYRSYANGALLGQWFENVEVFESCWLV